jgi:hypothetical protein
VGDLDHAHDVVDDAHEIVLKDTELAVRARLLEQREVLVLVRGTRIVADDDAKRVTVPPEVLIVIFDRLTHVAQALGGNHEDEIVWFHVTRPSR